MKIKITLSTILFALVLQTGFAQHNKITYPFWEGSVSMGLLPTFVKDKSVTELPPLLANVSYRVNKKFSVGLFVGHTRVNSSSNIIGDAEPETFRNKFSMAGIRFAIHSTYFKNWDIYGGMNYAYTHSNIEVIKGNVEQLKTHLNFKPSSGKMMSSAFIGSKYTPENGQFSFFGEVGYGISLVSFGLVRKL